MWPIWRNKCRLTISLHPGLWQLLSTGQSLEPILIRKLLRMVPNQRLHLVCSLGFKHSSTADSSTALALLLTRAPIISWEWEGLCLKFLWYCFSSYLSPERKKAQLLHCLVSGQWAFRYIPPVTTAEHSSIFSYDHTSFGCIPNWFSRKRHDKKCMKLCIVQRKWIERELFSPFSELCNVG